MADENENVAAEDRSQDAVGGEKTASNLPFIITLLALTLYFGFQTLQLASDRSNLTAVKSNQEAAMQEAQKVQVQFKTLVTKTSQLADQGHAGARMVMEKQKLPQKPRPNPPNSVRRFSPRASRTRSQGPRSRVFQRGGLAAQQTRNSRQK
ncbi:MAG: hypothetical protein E6J73_01015 [Deltaproteobacteria bacterium]|nr:MAG: hypothetical protein E6J73_01015 [Deltaproteobacteria bacterium]